MTDQLKAYYSYFVALILGISSLALPLIGDLHFESAFLASIIGSFWAAWSACDNDRKSDVGYIAKILGRVYVFAIPLFVHAIIVDCFTIHGLGFWVLLPLPSIFFGYSVGRLLRKWNVPYSKALTFIVLLGIALGVFLLEFFNYAQVYFFNHIWGYWPGPIYDETILVTPSAFYYRFITVLWILVLWILPSVRIKRYAKWIVTIALLALAVSYGQLSEAGIISPRSFLQEKLSANKTTAHFEIYYDERYYSQEEINRIAKEQEFYYKQISEALELEESTERIESYFYAHPWQKKKMVGAKFTSYVPVWLQQDQLHIAKNQIEGSLKHELVHVLAKQFGNDLFNASWSIGLVEGLATAISGGNSGYSTVDQIVLSQRPLPTAKEMGQAFSPLGFYGGRSAVNYITAASFVQYLLKQYPAGKMKSAYATADISEAYGASMDSLVSGWHQSLATLPVDSVDRQVSQRLFSIPSLFEQQCPHKVSVFGRHWDDYRYYTAEMDTAKALKSLEKALRVEEENLLIKREWAYRNLESGNILTVQFAANTQDSSAGLQLLYADAFALDKNTDIASSHINKAVSLAAARSGSAGSDAIATRSNLKQWQAYLKMSYKAMLPAQEQFDSLYYRTKVRAVQQAIKQEEWGHFKRYSHVMAELPVDERYVNDYLQMIHYLGYLQEFELARKWIAKLEKRNLRLRYEQRLKEQEEWVAFLDKN